MLIEWSEYAYDDLAEILSYFKETEKEELGYEIVSELFTSTEILAKFPLSGRLGRVSETRELVNQTFPYVIVYRIVSLDKIKILAVVHTSRLFPEPR